MNSAGIYKEAIKRKRTYIISSVLAASLAIGLAGVGVHDAMLDYAHDQEEKILSNVPYAEHFMECAPAIGWDWELLAAVAYHESRYNPNVVSHGGARGLMQLMPVTGRRFGLNDSTFFCPADNIQAGTQYIAHLQHQFRFVKDSVEQTKFVLASYNAGPAHILDARRLARKYGGNCNKWNDVEYWVGQLKYEEFYTDSVVQYGSFQGGETTRYVHNVLRTYQKIQQEEAKLQESLVQE